MDGYFSSWDQVYKVLVFKDYWNLNSFNLFANQSFDEPVGIAAEIYNAEICYTLVLPKEIFGSHKIQLQLWSRFLAFY